MTTSRASFSCFFFRFNLVSAGGTLVSAASEVYPSVDIFLILYVIHITDSIRPIITCPVISPSPNQPNEDYAMVDLPDATATDNSGFVSIALSHKSPLKVMIGTPAIVTYTASDEAGNKRQCSVHVQAKGNPQFQLIAKISIWIFFLFFLVSYVGERPWWPIQRPNKGRKKQAKG